VVGLFIVGGFALLDELGAGPAVEDVPGAT
jgi:hypothetical protein